MKLTKFFAFLFATLTFAACSDGKTDEPSEPTTPASGITLTADKTTVEIGETITFTVTNAENQDVTADAKIYDMDLNEVGSQIVLTEPGSYRYQAVVGNKRSNYVVVDVTIAAPKAPADPQPENFTFNHRSLVIDQTGVNCGYCPVAVDQLRALEQTEWRQYYNEVTCHAGDFAIGDPANSAAANALNQFQDALIPGYPCILVNFYGKPANYGYTEVIKVLNNYVKKEGVDVGVSLSVNGDASCVYAGAQVKSGVATKYKVTAWLLENQIYSPGQAGATQDYHKIYNHALRNMSHDYSRSNVQGGTYSFEANEVKDFTFRLPITSSIWKYQNMEVLVVVSAKNSTGKWEVANSAVCKINESKEFEYEL